VIKNIDPVKYYDTVMEPWLKFIRHSNWILETFLIIIKVENKDFAVNVFMENIHSYHSHDLGKYNFLFIIINNFIQQRGNNLMLLQKIYIYLKKKKAIIKKAQI